MRYTWRLFGLPPSDPAFLTITISRNQSSYFDAMPIRRWICSVCKYRCAKSNMTSLVITNLFNQRDRDGHVVIVHSSPGGLLLTSVQGLRSFSISSIPLFADIFIKDFLYNKISLPDQLIQMTVCQRLQTDLLLDQQHNLPDGNNTQPAS